VRVEPIKWNVEFKTGFHWSNSQYYQDIRHYFTKDKRVFLNLSRTIVKSCSLATDKAI